MDKKQIEQFNDMLSWLDVISSFMTLKQLQKEADTIWESYENTLEMAYENIILQAKAYKKWKKKINT